MQTLPTMIRLNLKPLSLNSAYRGRRFATRELSLYKQTIGLLSPILPQITGKLQAHYRFGMSSKRSDIDNCIKCLQDSLADKYGFNDNCIYKMVVEKVDVKKGKEFIEFNFTKYENTSI